MKSKRKFGHVLMSAGFTLIIYNAILYFSGQGEAMPALIIGGVALGVTGALLLKR
ncbi:hypothetical protein [Youngiibacter multivorans]|uniref:LPXTG cell wall anchor domain-containing protein n=1 Tax=Youngiibacter multivorans TaxID=937251 RepID=A0ABS4G674_9CLOT|nr:hypothetical protein [Youngiibacter multivorans]MBP1919952.1 hypothetical protein [Youngiibacter multivorans]